LANLPLVGRFEPDTFRIRAQTHFTWAKEQICSM